MEQTHEKQRTANISNPPLRVASYVCVLNQPRESGKNAVQKMEAFWR